jgi:hypothetical protein
MKSLLDEVYVALRTLLKVRFLSSDTRQHVTRAVLEIQKQAISEAIVTAISAEESSQNNDL